MPYLYYCCIDFDEIWWKDAEDQIFSRYRVQQRALSSKKKFCDFLWKFWPKHPLPGYPKKFLRDGTTRVLFSIKNCTDLDRYQKFCQQSRDHSITLKTSSLLLIVFDPWITLHFHYDFCDNCGMFFFFSPFCLICATHSCVNINDYYFHPNFHGFFSMQLQRSWGNDAL